ncbi:hypothetical protein BDW74DRAFT_177857 [Aspergillus multicolor]|uniref:uncharacterized protein n=1 Tax=Aspergillus multicolor TaxID=41759 RepID=UPI003CCCA29C
MPADFGCRDFSICNTSSEDYNITCNEADLSMFEKDASMPIAVVGIALRGPGDATNVEKLGDMLREGREACGELPSPANQGSQGAHGARHGCFLQEDISLFDASFFKLGSDEAAALHPQERLLLEVTYEALENAGITLAAVSGSRASCFVASTSGSSTPPEVITGQSEPTIAHNVSRVIELKGSSATIETTCSDGLVALHLACQSLQSSESSMAIVAGVNIISRPDTPGTVSATQALHPNGRTISHDVDGCRIGEGIACLILKPLKGALLDNDPVRAIVRGSGILSGENTANTMTSNRRGQNNLIRGVYDTAGLLPQSTEGIEIYGLKTNANYPNEIAAAMDAFGPRHPLDPLRLGSIQANIGHLRGAGGVAGIIKAVPVECEPWDTRGPHRVSVIGFNPGNTAHLILEDAAGYLGHRHLGTVHHIATHEHRRRARIFLISAMDEESLKTRVQGFQTYLQEKADDSSDTWMNNLAFTLSERRTAHLYRAVVTSKSVPKLRTRLTPRIKIHKAGKTPVIGFVFTGQGAQWPGMGKDPLESHPVFRQSMERVNNYISKLGAPYNIIDEILRDKGTSNLDDPFLSQPICSALQIALVDLLASWGIYPDAVAGHSSGEIAAAYAAGMATMEDAITIAYYRGVLESALCKDKIRGAMTAAGLSASEVEPYVAALRTGKATVGCINSPTRVTISGDAPAIEELEIVLETQGVFVRRLEVEVAYHSHHMDYVAREHLKSMASIKPVAVKDNARRVQFFSSVTGCEVSSTDLGPQYWLDNLAGQVRMVDAIEALCLGTESHYSKAQAKSSISVDTLIEVGPHAALAGPIRQILKANSDLDKVSIEYTSVLIKGMDATSSALAVAASLACKGLPVSIQAINRPDDTYKPQVLVDLPPYSWNHTTSYGMEPPICHNVQSSLSPSHDKVGELSTPCGPSTETQNHRTVYKIVWEPDLNLSAEGTMASNLSETNPIMTGKSPQPIMKNPSTVQIIREDGDFGVCMAQLQSLLKACQYTVGISDMHRTRPEDVTGKFCIVLSELKYSILGLLEEGTLRKIQHLLQTAAGILWVTRGGTGKPTYPESSLITGFARSVRLEYSTNPFVTLD